MEEDNFIYSNVIFFLFIYKNAKHSICLSLGDESGFESLSFALSPLKWNFLFREC